MSDDQAGEPAAGGLNSEVGANSFTVQVTDSFNESATATLNVTVANTNDAPVFTSNPISGGAVTEDAAYSGSIASHVSDVDAADTKTFNKVSGPAWLSVAPTGALSGTPPAGSTGLNTFVVSATDASSATDEAEVRIIVGG